MKTHDLNPSGTRDYVVEFHSKAEQEFEALPEDVKERFEERIDALQHAPRVGRPGLDIKKMSEFTSEDVYRLRVGNYRALYTIGDENKIVIILLFDSRGAGYGRLQKIVKARML